MNPMQRERTERDRQYLLRKITSQAEGRMRARTAKEQHAEYLASLKGPNPDDVPDADDSSVFKRFE